MPRISQDQNTAKVSTEEAGPEQQAATSDIAARAALRTHETENQHISPSPSSNTTKHGHSVREQKGISSASTPDSRTKGENSFDRGAEIGSSCSNVNSLSATERVKAQAGKTVSKEPQSVSLER